MFTTLRAKFLRARFNWTCRGIFRTPPIQPRAAPVRIVSLVRGDDHLLYLLAIKSFYRYLPGGEIVIIDDGTLSDRHRELFRHHLGAPRFVAVQTLETAPCPRGSCWERLLHILDLSRDSYVIQLDSDMLTIGPVPEIVDAIRENRAFTLSTGPDQVMVSVDAAAAFAASMETDHIQHVAERLLPTLPAGMGRRYVRGSAGFAGFAKGGPSRQDAEAFSAAMEASIGSRWNEWGTEQVASNYLVSNSPNGMALSWPKYACHFPDVEAKAATMMHFVGSWRWDHGTYSRWAKQVIGELMRPTQEDHPLGDRTRTAEHVSRDLSLRVDTASKT